MKSRAEQSKPEAGTKTEDRGGDRRHGHFTQAHELTAHTHTHPLVKVGSRYPSPKPSRGKAQEADIPLTPPWRMPDQSPPHPLPQPLVIKASGLHTVRVQKPRAVWL